MAYNVVSNETKDEERYADLRRRNISDARAAKKASQRAQHETFKMQLEDEAERDIQRAINHTHINRDLERISHGYNIITNTEHLEDPQGPISPHTHQIDPGEPLSPLVFCLRISCL